MCWPRRRADVPPRCAAEAEGAAQLRMQQAEVGWSLELQRLEARLGDSTAARAKLEQQVAALTQVRAATGVRVGAPSRAGCASTS